MSFSINIRRSLVAIAGFIAVICTLCACTKNGSSQPVVHVITYKLIANDYTPFNHISYTDSVGIQESVSAADSTSGWSKIVNEPYSNFPVTLEVQGQNSTSSQLTYSLEIIVDGSSKSNQQYSTAAFGSYSNQISIVIP
ncbi:MAG: hypothetical protein JO072_02450 [Parafilimonas sp.]|nr:hypothetical protein [Parafilimonas sp.]